MLSSVDLLKGRCLYVPRMGEASVRAFVAAFRSMGIEAAEVPPSDSRTLELSAGHSSGEECFPARVTLGDFLKVVESEGPDRVALFMPTARGPCRFGQYSHFLRQVLEKLGYAQVPVFSPSSWNGYDGIAMDMNGFLRTGWRAIMAADILQRALLQTRPYEKNPGETDAVYNLCLDDLCKSLERRGTDHRTRMELLSASQSRARNLFRSIPVIRKKLPLVGVVGEIFCRLNIFSNQDIIRRIESHGAECWLSGISEWLAYTNLGQQERLLAAGKRFSPAMGKAKIKNWIQNRDEHALLKPFREDLREEASVEDVLARSQPYLPNHGALGEMVLSVGKAIYLWEKGASGIVDVSPFSCMNGIVCQAIYPRVSDEHDGIPIRVFFFDQIQKDLDQDIAIFMDLVRTYQSRKHRPPQGHRSMVGQA
jgi:predicted nucleotide-binding protein (sugar kinase/HSP70/actin superfamily)